MNRVYPNRIDWENEPSTNTPINETNLNKIDYAVYEIDGRVVNYDLTKANQSDLLQTIKTLTYNTTTGVFVFEFWNGGTYTVDLNIEKIPVSFSMSESGVITMVTADGTTYTCDISTLIKLYTFVDSSEIDFTTTTDASGNKNITASIKTGSIAAEKLQPNFLADCIAAKNAAELAASNAQQSEDDANASALVSEGWANGKQNGVPVTEGSPYYENNAKHYSEEARHFTPEGYQELVDDIDYYEQNGYLSKNLFKVVAKTTTEQGVLYTVNNDGTITTTRQSTSSSNASINIGDFTLPVGSYKISGANNAGNGAYFTLRNASNNAFIANIQADGYDLSVTDASFAYRLTCVVSSSVSPTGNYATVSPMVRKSNANSAYTPYAPSNNALDSKKSDITAIGTDESGRTTASKAYAVGEHFYKDGKFCTAKTAIASGATFTLNTNYEDGDVADKVFNTEKIMSVKKGELLLFEPIWANNRAWSGSSLEFTIPQNNGRLYHFVAMSTTGVLVDYYFINRTNGVISAKSGGDATATFSYSDGKLTINFSSSEYWLYKLEVIKQDAE